MKRILLAGACLFFSTCAATADCPYAAQTEELVRQDHAIAHGPSSITCADDAAVAQKMITIGEQLLAQSSTAQNQTPAKPSTFGAVSVATWLEKDGKEQVGVGIVYGYRSQDEADAAAIRGCMKNTPQEEGAKCKTPIQFSGGQCTYITVGVSGSRANYGLGTTADEATEQCRDLGGVKFTCKPPIGGCTQ